MKRSTIFFVITAVGIPPLSKESKTTSTSTRAKNVRKGRPKGPRINLVGSIFGTYKVLEVGKNNPTSSHAEYSWIVECSECLNIMEISLPRLKRQSRINKCLCWVGQDPENCRIVTQKVNIRNRGMTKKVTIFGEEIVLAAALELYSPFISFDLAKSRLLRGWPDEAAVLLPPLRNTQIGKIVQKQVFSKDDLK